MNRTERDLLALLADEWDTAGPPGYLETTIVAKRLQKTLPAVKAAIQSLFEKGLVDTDKVDIFAAYLTPEGYEFTRQG
ncbi:MAG: hypothetical protein R3274_07345 [Desulfobacterales bacterium]|nr:hypothetical protein [Desulfobacterales bacterium]